jgi:hypothetical protein
MGHAMNWDAVGAIAELVGALAVIATLIYLSGQIREAARSKKLQAAQFGREQRIQWFKDARDSSVWAKIRAKRNAGDPLTEEEAIQESAHIAGLWALTYSEWVQRQLSTAREFDLKAYALRTSVGSIESRE